LTLLLSIAQLTVRDAVSVETTRSELIFAPRPLQSYPGVVACDAVQSTTVIGDPDVPGVPLVLWPTPTMTVCANTAAGVGVAAFDWVPSKTARMRMGRNKRFIAPSPS
jgi:hypothetical protein